MQPKQLSGILPVLYSFFDTDGSLRYDGYSHQVEHSMENGANGVVLFGFVTQFYRLSFEEKIEAIRTTKHSLGDRGSLGVTVMEQTPAAQAELMQVARDEGADWIIMQPPLGPPVKAKDWLAMLTDLTGNCDLPLAVQNADIANAQLSNTDIIELQSHCSNLIAVKAETSTLDVADFSRDHRDKFRIITGDWGLEFPFLLRQGAHGLIPAPNFVGEQVALFNAAESGNWTDADDIHRTILPLLNFLRGRPDLESQMLLGKHAYCMRNNYEIGSNRAPGPNSVDSRLLAHLVELVRSLE